MIIRGEFPAVQIRGTLINKWKDTIQDHLTGEARHAWDRRNSSYISPNRRASDPDIWGTQSSLQRSPPHYLPKTSWATPGPQVPFGRLARSFRVNVTSGLFDHPLRHNNNLFKFQTDEIYENTKSVISLVLLTLWRRLIETKCCTI